MSREEKAQKALVRRMGVDPEHDWAAVYEILPNKTKVIRELKALAKEADKIYLATDLDREGEAIAWHLKEVIGGSDDKYSRVVFNEITKTAIQTAFEHPDQLNIDRVNAQQARRFFGSCGGLYGITTTLGKRLPEVCQRAECKVSQLVWWLSVSEKFGHLSLLNIGKFHQ